MTWVVVVGCCVVTGVVVVLVVGAVVDELVAGAVVVELLELREPELQPASPAKVASASVKVSERLISI